MVIFPNLFFQAKQRSKISFTIFQNEKTLFQAIKIKNSKTRKIDIFPKWLTHGFGPKMVNFRKPFFQAIQPRKMSVTIFQNEKTPFQAIKTKNLKSLKIVSFPIELTHGFGPKKSIFLIFFYPIYIGQENDFYDILQRKNSFLGYEKRFKKSKNLHFSKGINQWFWSENGYFSKHFFFNPIQARKMSFTICYNEKTLFYAIKATSSKSKKN